MAPSLVPQILELQQVPLEPLVYIGHQYVLDPLSNLVYLPTAKKGTGGAAAKGRTAWSNSSTLPGVKGESAELKRWVLRMG